MGVEGPGRRLGLPPYPTPNGFQPPFLDLESMAMEFSKINGDALGSCSSRSGFRAGTRAAARSASEEARVEQPGQVLRGRTH